MASRESLQEKLRELQEELPGRFSMPESCTNFVYLDVPQAKALYQGLLAHGIAIRLMGDHLRVTAGSEQENDSFLQAFRALLSEVEV